MKAWLEETPKEAPFDGLANQGVAEGGSSSAQADEGSGEKQKAESESSSALVDKEITEAKNAEHV